MILDKWVWKFINVCALILACVLVFMSIVGNKPFYLFVGIATFAYHLRFKQSKGL